jgi:branched-chain amino acid transport system ATP-binding protein
MNDLELVEVTGGYTKAPILWNVNLAVRECEMVGVFGANGAGKTTLLRALSGNLPTCRGEIRLGDRSLGHLAPWVRVKAGLAHVPEGRHVFAELSVEDNLRAASLTRGLRHRSSVVVFDLFPRLGERRRQLAGTLSGGEQQMLAIGRALMTAPRILAIDEMSAGLAPVIVQELVQGLSKLRDQNISVLLVEQSPAFVADALDRAYQVERGRVIGGGTMTDLGGVDRLAERYLGMHPAARSGTARAPAKGVCPQPPTALRANPE